MKRRGTLEISISLEGLEEMLAALEALGHIEAAMDEAARAGAEVLLAEANLHAPGPHIVIEETEKRRGAVTWAIGPDAEHWYYRYLETGAGPHEIMPHVRKALTVEGFVRARVRHPGLVARPFLRPALDGKREAALKAAGEALMAHLAKIRVWRGK